MMNTKLLEIRDEGTCILTLAIRMQATVTGIGDRTFTDPAVAKIEHWFLHHRSGYPECGSSIMLMCLNDGRATNDPYEWPARGMGKRTMGNAHHWIIDHYDELKDGDVVDVQVILGETTKPKVSERLRLSTWQDGGRVGGGLDETGYPHEPDVFTMAEYRRNNTE